jgi:hypothetical protein
MYDLINMFQQASSQFIGQSLHFGVNLFAALACLAAGWLYLDAWSGRHLFREFSKGCGFLLLTAAFIITGAVTDNGGWLELISNLLKLVGYLSIATGRLIEPIQPRPKIAGYTPALFINAVAPATIASSFFAPIAALTVSLLYWRAAVIGLERHLRPVAIVFTIFTLSDVLAVLVAQWHNGSNPLLQPLAAPLGILWILEHAILLIGAAILARWVWHYLAKRLLSQLFLSITSLTFAIVLLATVSVSALLLGNLQRDALTSLTTATKVLNYAIDSQTADTRSDAEVLAQNPDVVGATNTRDHAALAQLANTLLVQKQLSEAVITDDAGLVLARASDPERYGDSLSNDPLVQHALLGTTTSTIQSRSGTLSPTLVITTASPIRLQGQIIGLSLTSLALDNAFVDGLKHTTSLDSTILAGSTRAATTLTGTDGASRLTGTKETRSEILTRTLKQGQIWQGVTTVVNQPYLAVYLPLKDIDNSVVGMLFVGQPQDTVLQSSKQAINLTFVYAALSLLLIMLPVYLIARQISRQLH